MVDENIRGISDSGFMISDWRLDIGGWKLNIKSLTDYTINLINLPKFRGTYQQLIRLRFCMYRTLQISVLDTKPIITYQEA